MKESRFTMYIIHDDFVETDEVQNLITDGIYKEKGKR